MTHNTVLRHGRVVPGLLAAVLFATGIPQSAQGRPRSDWPRLIREWQSQYGSTWRVQFDNSTGYASFLFGGRAQALGTAHTDTEYFRLAREYFAEAGPLFGLQEDTLVPDQLMLIPMGLAGTTDKVSVRFAQEVDGVPVRGGFANALFHVGGELLALQTTGMPNLSGFETTPTVTPENAARFALDTFRRETGTPVTSHTEPSLYVDRDRSAGAAGPRLVWQVQVMHELPGGAMPEGYIYGIQAKSSPRVVSRRDAIHYFDVGGTVMTKSTPGTEPDKSTNPEIPFPAAYMTVTSGAQTTTSDASGNFSLTGVSGPVNVTFRYEGLFNDVENVAGANHTLTASLSGTENLVLMNASPTEANTAQSNVFYQINRMRDWTRSLNPADAMMDSVNTANVMISNTCNAFYDYSSTNYYNAGNGCPNTAYSTVIHHEQGHWQNDRYGSGNGPDGFGEGNADVFAMYISDSPIVGDGFSGTGTFLRTGLNTRQYCGDGNPGCYGEVHDDGEVLMGALWKVRRNLKNSDPQIGGLTADLLFSSWMNTYDQQTIHSVIETQWLTLDDDDGDISNGTPHFSEIDSAFQEQGFPGVPLSLEIWVDFSFAGVELGTEQNPFNTLAEGVAAVAPTGLVRIKAGSSPETYTISKVVILQAVGGSATIGQ